MAPSRFGEMRRYPLHINVALTIVLSAICATVVVVVRAGKQGNGRRYSSFSSFRSCSILDCNSNVMKTLEHVVHVAKWVKHAKSGRERNEKFIIRSFLSVESMISLICLYIILQKRYFFTINNFIHRILSNDYYAIRIFISFIRAFLFKFLWCAYNFIFTYIFLIVIDVSRIYKSRLYNVNRKRKIYKYRKGIR